MTDGPVGGEPIPGLQVGIKVIERSALGAGFVGEVALGHPNIIGAENAAPRAGKRLGEHRQRGHPALGTHRTHPNPPNKAFLVQLNGPSTQEIPYSRDQLRSRVEAFAVPGVPSQDGFHALPGDQAPRIGHSLDLLDDGQQILGVVLGIELSVLGGIAPGFCRGSRRHDGPRYHPPAATAQNRAE